MRPLLRSLEYAFACDFASAFVCVFAFACVLHLCMRFYVLACAFACVCACAGMSFVCVFACACLRRYMRLYASFRVHVYAFVCAFCGHVRVLRSRLQMSVHARAWTRFCMFLCALCMHVCMLLPTPLHARVIAFACACMMRVYVSACICFGVPLCAYVHALVSVFARACALACACACVLHALVYVFFMSCCCRSVFCFPLLSRMRREDRIGERAEIREGDPPRCRQSMVLLCGRACRSKMLRNVHSLKLR